MHASKEFSKKKQKKMQCIRIIHAAKRTSRQFVGEKVVIGADPGEVVEADRDFK